MLCFFLSFFYFRTSANGYRIQWRDNRGRRQEGDEFSVCLPDALRVKYAPTTQKRDTYAWTWNGLVCEIKLKRNWVTKKNVNYGLICMFVAALLCFVARCVKTRSAVTGMKTPTLNQIYRVPAKILRNSMRKDVIRSGIPKAGVLKKISELIIVENNK